MRGKDSQGRAGKEDGNKRPFPNLAQSESGIVQMSCVRTMRGLCEWCGGCHFDSASVSVWAGLGWSGSCVVGPGLFVVLV